MRIKSLSVENRKLLILLAVSLLFSITMSMILTRIPNILSRSDHFSLWYCVNRLVTIDRSLYDPQNGIEVVSITSVPVDPIEGGFYYPAHLIIFFLPIAQLPYPIAHFLWVLAVQLFFIIGIFLLYNEIKWPENVNQFTIFLLLSILFVPNLQNTIWGQYNSIGVLFLALIYIALRRNKYFLSGILAIGLTFKPQNYLLALLFLIFWAFSKRERWAFIYGFVISCFAFWLFAEIFEPHWVVSFINRLKVYNEFHQSLGVLDYHRLPHLIIIVLLIIFYGWLFINNYKSDARSHAFIGCLVFGLCLWWIIVPVVGMMHLTALPIVAMCLFNSLKNYNSKLYKIGLICFLCLYGLGLLGFIYGLSNTELYGLHIKLAELVYKVAMPILIMALALPLCHSKSLMKHQATNRTL